MGGLAINANGAAQFAGYWYQSDERIKTDIVPMPTSECLSTLQNIVISKYDYANIYAGSSTGVVGFIAQQLETVDENFVTKKRDFIANANTEVSLSLISFSGSSGSYSATYTFSLPLSPSGPTFALGDCVRFFYINNPNNKFIEGHIISATEKEEQQYIFTTSSLHDLLPDTMFCFGKRVEDFCIVAKDRIFAYGIGAIQEVSKQNDVLREENLHLRQRLEAQENIVASLLSALKTATSLEDLQSKL